MAFRGYSLAMERLFLEAAEGQHTLRVCRSTARTSRCLTGKRFPPVQAACVLVKGPCTQAQGFPIGLALIGNE